MKLDLTSLYFNGDTETPGNTACWGTSLGQKEPEYLISVAGAMDLIQLIKSHHFDFDPSNENHSSNIRNIKSKKILYSGRFEKVWVNDIEVKGPFFLLVIEEKTGKHSGRKILKYNNETTVEKNSNSQFYQRVQDWFGANACWFVHEIFPKDGRLHMTAVKVSDHRELYKTPKQRSAIWKSLIDRSMNYTEIQDQFKQYCLDVRKMKNVSSVNEYIKFMPDVQDWFIEKRICGPDFEIWNIHNNISHIKQALEGPLKTAWKDAAKKNETGDHGFKMAAWNSWTKFLEWRDDNEPQPYLNVSHMLEELINDTKSCGLKYDDLLFKRLISSLMTKPFLILSGLSGSGKTKIAQVFTYWITQNSEQYEIVPVGADWTNREPLLGYPDGLNPELYVQPDSKVLELILRASKSDLPHFLILDEMNLSHVERYFADFLSIMESGEKAKLYSGRKRKDNSGNEVPEEIIWPNNLFIVGTVNIDESTYMFSPKVLDRANVIEFRINSSEMDTFLLSDPTLDLSKLVSKGQKFSKSFLSKSNENKIPSIKKENATILIDLFDTFKLLGAEFGYRSAAEIIRLIHFLGETDPKLKESVKMDISVMQKLLPKLHGSGSRLNSILVKLGKICLKDASKWDDYIQNWDDLDITNEKNIVYKISFEKILRMYRNSLNNGFASYAEA